MEIRFGDLPMENVPLVPEETERLRAFGGDNLSGFPAAIFLGGGETLVGTLWKVDSSVAEIFFTEFYGDLRGGETRRNAFAAAQRSAREWSPQYRHLGRLLPLGSVELNR